MGFDLDLELPDVDVLRVDRDAKGDYLIELHSTKDKGICRQCGREIRHFKGYDEWIQIRHLPVLGRAVYLRIRPRRYQCLECENEPTTSEEFSWRSPRKSYTKAYQDHVLRSLMNSTIDDVCLKEGLGEKHVESMLSQSFFGKDPLKHIQSIGTLGLDEIALKKGHQNFVVIVSSRVNDRTRVLGVLKDRKKATVLDFLKEISSELRATIKNVCTDMYEGYLNAVKEALGEQVEIVIDRFHVAQTYRKSADALRKQEQKRLKKELPEAEYQKLKGLIWAFRKHPEDLIEKDRQILEKAFTHSPDLKKAYEHRNTMTEIFDMPLSKTEAIERFQNWQESVKQTGLTCFDGFLKTLNTFQSQIANFFNEGSKVGKDG
ncbi:MAG: ISL3 family transposase [SAR324 cluster bacterium]|nr:ISL3 family transposase [SAR324 cluster bacterium]